MTEIRDEKRNEIIDDFGYIYIPNEISYYFILLQDTLNIVSSRVNMLASSVFSINLNDIQPINDRQNPDFNGVQDMVF